MRRSTSRAGSRHPLVLLLALLTLLAASITVPASTGHRQLLILNSDGSIGKYRQNQMEFTATAGLTTVEIDLNRQQLDVAGLQQLLNQQQPELIYTVGSKAYLLARQAKASQPIIFSSVINYRRLPLDQSSFGISGELPPAMQLTLFRHLFPQLQNIGVLYSGQYNEQWFRTASRQARKMGFRLLGQKITSPQDLSSGLASLLPQVQGLWLVADPLVFSSQSALEDIFQAAHQRQVAVLTYSKAFRPFKPTLILAVDDPTVGRQAAAMARNIRQGRPPARQVLPPAGSAIMLDMAKVKQYGLELNSRALASVNELLE